MLVEFGIIIILPSTNRFVFSDLCILDLLYILWTLKRLCYLYFKISDSHINLTLPDYNTLQTNMLLLKL